MIIEVIIPLAFNEAFSYEYDDELNETNAKIGDLIKVPFGNREFIGVISNINTEVKEGIKLKKTKEKIDLPPLKQELIDFIKWTSEYNLIPLGNVLKMVISPVSFLKNKVGKKYILNPLLDNELKTEDLKITEKQELIINFLNKNKISNKEDILTSCNVGDGVLKKLIEKDIVKEILEEKNLLQEIDVENFNLNTLSKDQERAFNYIVENSREEIIDTKQEYDDKEKEYKLKFNTIVVEGATGSGKTEVYFHIIAKILQESNKQVLLLLPEIALTTQLISRFKSQFNFEPAVWHSDITESVKSDIFKSVLSSNVRVVIGTRSSLFLPFKNLGLIIVDEEHDSSYKQTEKGCYNARDLAVLRAKMNNAPILLASATPSLETLINIDKDKYLKVDLPSRYGKAVLPDIEIIDMKKEKLKKDKYISKKLLEDLQENLKIQKQSMLFMNKRGYANLLLCSECGEKFICKNCSCNLSVHKSKNKLVCHYCGYARDIPNKCDKCGNESLINFGPGVEKIEKEIKEYFPNAKTIIMSSDTINTNKKLEEAINQITKNEVDIIIGTQLVAKGHHFPNLTLVGIIDSDASLFGGDIKASERTYQLLTQVSGRAGREKDKGKVYFQSYNHDNLVLQAIKDGNKEILIDFEKQSRELGNFPPYGKMAIISISSLKEVEAYTTAKNIAKKIPTNEDIEIFGPAPAIIAKIAKMYKFNVIVKTSKKMDIQKLITKFVLSEKYNSKLRIKIEII